MKERLGVKRVILNPGHGLGNVSHDVYDPGASSDGFEEAAIVRGVCSAVAVTPRIVGLHFAITPFGRSLGDVIRWCNSAYMAGDMVLSVHMNAGGGTGCEVLYSATAPTVRSVQAGFMSAAIAKRLGIPDRGGKSDEESARGKLGILRHTKAPAMLVELGFIDSAKDRKAVMSAGAEAIIAGLKAIGAG